MVPLMGLLAIQFQVASSEVIYITSNIKTGCAYIFMHIYTYVTITKKKVVITLRETNE